MKKVLKIRVDADNQIGYGHLMRMLSLAEIIQSEFSIEFFSIDTDKRISSIVADSNFTLVSIKEETEFIQSIKSEDFIILDNYHFDLNYQKKVKELCKYLIIVDDWGSGAKEADMIINHSMLREAISYNTNLNTVILSEPQYALVHPDFYKLSKTKGGNRIFICLGSGVEQAELESIISSQLKKYTRHEIDIVSNQLIKLSLEINGRVHFHSKLKRAEIIALINSCEFGICAASTIALEFLFSNKLLFVIETVDNQINSKKLLIERGYALDYYHPEKKRLNKKRLVQTFNGDQKERILGAFKALG